MDRRFPSDVQTLEEKQLATPSLKLLTTLLIFMTLVGITAGVYASMTGHRLAYGVSREIPWGIVMSSFAFMANMATGLCLVAVIGHASGATTLAPIGTRAVYLAIVAVVAAFMLFGLSVENPWRVLIYNATSPNLTSNIWWLTTLYGIMSGCLFLKFSCHVSGRRGWAISFGVIGAVAGVGANNNLGGLFTLAADPPIWYGFQLLILFLDSAVMSGMGAAIFFTYFAKIIRKQKITGETLRALHGAGTILSLTLIILLVIGMARFSAMFFGDTPEPGRAAALALLTGPLAFNFWVMEILVGIIVPLGILVGTKVNNIPAMTVAAGLALLGGFFQRYDLVISGQIVPKFAGWDNLPLYLSYSPTIAELLVVIGGFALAGAGFLLGERFIGRVFRYY
jgi:molybdopterin-containing oxidoreductase family membrane subunit